MTYQNGYLRQMEALNEENNEGCGREEREEGSLYVQGIEMLNWFDPSKHCHID